MPERKLASALRYDGATAPKLVATGRGVVADNILARAKELGLPVHEDPALARALDALDLGQEIPQELYLAVAEVIAWAYALDRRNRPR